MISSISLRVKRKSNKNPVLWATFGELLLLLLWDVLLGGEASSESTWIPTVQTLSLIKPTIDLQSQSLAGKRPAHCNNTMHATQHTGRAQRSSASSVFKRLLYKSKRSFITRSLQCKGFYSLMLCFNSFLCSSWKDCNRISRGKEYHQPTQCLWNHSCKVMVYEVKVPALSSD